jgi:hypothetical protein
MTRRSSVAIAGMLDPEKKGVGEMHKNFLGERFADFVREWKCCLLIVFFILTVGSMGMALQSVKQASGVPQIFPDDHNQVMGKAWDEKFNNFDEDIANLAKKSATECNDLFQECTQFRCETHGRAMGSPTDCQCYPYGVREPAATCGNPRSLRVYLRVLGRQGLPSSAVSAANLSTVVAQEFPDALKVTPAAAMQGVSECLVESWDTGRQRLAVMINPGHVDVIARADAPGEAPLGSEAECTEKQLCYCGIERCAGSNQGSSTGFLHLPGLRSNQIQADSSGGRRLGLHWDDKLDEIGQYDTKTQVNDLRVENEKLGAENRKLKDTFSIYDRHPLARHLQDTTAVSIHPSNEIDANIIFGMEVTGSSPLLGPQKTQAWEYRPSFNLQDPWAQRRFERLCKEMPQDKTLKIMRSSCWLIGFRDVWIGEGNDWPVRPIYDMNSEVITYANNFMTDGFQTTTYIWIEGGVVKATFVPFILSVPKTVDSTLAMELMGEWTKYTEEFNSQAEPAIKGIWHASKLWVRAEAEKVIIDSTLNTLAISLGCVWIGIFIFTRSMHLAFLVMIVVMSIIICLLFFMTVMMEWPIGAIEVLSLIVFVGFAVDYCLHVAHKYHTCHINAVTDLPPEEEDEEDMDALASESPKGRLSQSSSQSHRTSISSRSRGRASTMSSNSGGRTSKTGRTSRSRRSTIAIDIGDKPLETKTVPHQAKAAVVLLAMNRPEERFARCKYALERMGGAVMGSAFTTVGCAAFLLPCQLLIFVKIGSVVMAVTIYAILYTILPLPALLMQCGPCGNDFKAFVDFVQNISRGLKKKPNDAVDEEEEERLNAPRKYVLHMPTRAMGTVGPSTPATRTRVTASG